MKIHIHTPSYFPALVGMTYATHVHAQMFKELGADVTVVAPLSDDTEVSEFVDYRVRRFAALGSGLPWNPFRGDIDGILQFTQDDRPDIIIAEGWFTLGAALLPRMKSRGFHVVLASHGAADHRIRRLAPAEIGRSLLYRWDEKTRSEQIIKSLSAALVLSAYEDDDRFRDVRRLRKAGASIYVCPNISTYSSSNGHSLRPDRVDVVHVGEMKPHKDAKQAVRAVAALPSKFHLNLVFPTETPYLAEVIGLARQLGLSSRLSLIEGRNRSELEPIIATMDVLLVTTPSKDVQPIVAVDALAKGVPFVSTDVGCMREFGGGVVTSADQLANAIERICRDPETYSQFSSEACAYRDRALTRPLALRALKSLIDDLGQSQ